MVYVLARVLGSFYELACLRMANRLAIRLSSNKKGEKKSNLFNTYCFVRPSTRLRGKPLRRMEHKLSPKPSAVVAGGPATGGATDITSPPWPALIPVWSRADNAANIDSLAP